MELEHSEILLMMCQASRGESLIADDQFFECSLGRRRVSGGGERPGRCVQAPGCAETRERVHPRFSKEKPPRRVSIEAVLTARIIHGKPPRQVVMARRESWIVLCNS